MGAPTRFEWLYSGKAFLAGMLAFYLALLLQLPNPYWSFATVYIVSHPLSGATRSKGVYRAFGTVAGAAAALVLVPAFAESPLLLVAAIGCWMGVALYLSLGDNTPRSYAFLLASYTTPLIAVPTILAPGSIFDVAVARTEEILLGIVCASVVSIAVFPSRVSPVFHARVTALLRDAGEWAGSRLEHLGHAAPPPLRLRLLSDVLALDALITHLSFDATRRGQADEARQIRVRMTMLVPQVASLSDALAALDAFDPAQHRDLQPVLDDTVAWMRKGTATGAHEGVALRSRAAALASHAGGTSLRQVIVANAIDRLRELIDLWQDCIVLHAAFNDHGPAPLLTYRARALDHRARHDNRGARLLAAASPAAAVMMTGGLWLLSDWPGGSGGVVLAALSTAFFASSDTPAIQVGRFVQWQAIAIAIAGIYLYAVFPSVTTFAGVVLVMAPPFIVLGAFTGRPQYTTGVVLVTSQTISAIALQNNLAPGFEDFANAGAGMMLGLGFALVWTLVTRPFSAERAARRLSLANWQDHARLADREPAPKHLAEASRVLDRTMQWLPRLAMATGESLVGMDAVRDMRLCLALLDLQTLRDRAIGDTPDITGILEKSRRYFLDCIAHGVLLPPPEDLLTTIDRAAADQLPLHTHAARLLVVYRLALMPPSSPPSHNLPTSP